MRGNGEFPLREADTTVAELLRTAGYTTVMFGKWGLGLEGTSGEPQRTGWDHFVGHLHHIDAHFQQPDSLWRLEKGELARFAAPAGSFANDLFTEEAVRFIAGHPAGRPFFLYLSLTIPHAELRVPQEDLRPYLTPAGESVFAPEIAWPEGRHYGPQPYPRAAYAALVGSTDRYVGRVLAALEGRGLARNTLVIFTSDNGTHVEGGRRIADIELFRSSGEHRGVKRDLYEGGIRVPFLAWWPGRVAAGRVSDHVGAFWDVLPTFAELAGAKPPADIDGISFVPTLLGTGAQPRHDHLYWEFHEEGGKQAVRMGRWKGVRLDLQQDPSAPIELYDVASDPGERRDVASRHPRIVRRIRAAMGDRSRSELAQWNFLEAVQPE